MLKGRWFDPASGAGEDWFFVEPGGVSREITFGRAHLMYPPSHKFPQGHKGLRCQVRGVVVIGGGGSVGVPGCEHHVSGSNT